MNWVCEHESLCGSEEEDGGKSQLKAFQLLKVVELNGQVLFTPFSCPGKFPFIYFRTKEKPRPT